MSDAAEALAALRGGGVVIVPTDTVYGLVCNAADSQAVARMCRLKGRTAGTPTAALAVDVDALVAVVPELRGRSETLLRALLPGALTLVLPNPARRLPWLSGDRPDTIGVRVPELSPPVRNLVEEAGVLAATSANLTGGSDPRRLDQVDRELLEGVAATIDGGTLPGAPSTVLDATGRDPVVLREGAVAATVVLEYLASVPGWHGTTS